MPFWSLSLFDWCIFCVCVLSTSLSIIRAFVIGFMMTFFEVFDVPVFWPILLFYWVLLFILTMRKQIQHMIKYRYVPFSFGKQVCVFFCYTLQNVAYLTIVFCNFCSWFLLLAEIWKETCSSGEQWMIKSTGQFSRSFLFFWLPETLLGMN